MPDKRCSRCGCQIVNLMEINGRDPRLDYIGIDGVIKAKCCPNCFIFSDDDFCRYTIDGESEIIMSDAASAEDYLGDSGIDELSSNTYVLGNTPVPVRYAADWVCSLTNPAKLSNSFASVKQIKIASTTIERYLEYYFTDVGL